MSEQRLETCWRVVAAPSGHIVTCGLYETPTRGVELRVACSRDSLLRSQPVADRESARALAQLWLDVARAKGDFSDLADMQP